MNSHPDSAQQEFLQKHQLTTRYWHHAQQWFFPVAEEINAHHDSAGRPLLIAINGSQGSGKSTVADYFKVLFETRFHKRTVVMSLDDFYLNQQQRQKLAEQVHPLLATRGVPGTHDIERLKWTLNALLQGKHCQIPLFNKATDNPFPEEQWPLIDFKAELILLEGWCWCTPFQTVKSLLQPVNELEREKDPHGLWRSYVNTQIQQQYEPLYKLNHIKLMLKAPSFQCVHQWRMEQEQKLMNNLAQEADTSAIMSEQQVLHFISYFQRLTEHSLQVLPAQCHYVWQLTPNRDIISLNRPKVLSL